MLRFKHQRENSCCFQLQNMEKFVNSLIRWFKVLIQDYNWMILKCQSSLICYCHYFRMILVYSFLRLELSSWLTSCLLKTLLLVKKWRNCCMGIRLEMHYWIMKRKATSTYWCWNVWLQCIAWNLKRYKEYWTLAEVSWKKRWVMRKTHWLGN
jgi:hypothetical protein